MSDDNYPPNEGQFHSSGQETSGENIEINHDDASLEDLKALLVEKDHAIAEMNDRFLRLAAELENTRRRAEREKQDAGRYAITELARELVGVADNFDRALQTVPAEGGGIAPDQVDGLMTGLRMTEKELLTILTRYDVHRIFPVGERFDPNLHQAVAQVPADKVPTGHVVEVVQPGFTIGSRVLRAAMVTISLGATAQNTGHAVDPNISDSEPGGVSREGNNDPAGSQVDTKI